MKRQIITMLILIIVGSARAQKDGQYLHFDVGGGLHNLGYNLQNGIENGLSGYTLGASYSYFLNSNWGISTGVGLQSFGALSTLNYLSTSQEIDAEGDLYEFRNDYKNWQERQKVLSVNIPLELQYRYFFNRKLGVLASGGAKISIPIVSNYSTIGGQMVTSGYYEKWNVVLSNLPQHGFGTITKTYSGNISLKPACFGVVDFGALYKLSKNFDLYAGSYLNVGLNNLLTPGTKLVYEPNDIYNGIFASNQIDKVVPVAFGFKAAVYWKIGDRFKSKPIYYKKKGVDVVGLETDSTRSNSLKRNVVNGLDTIKTDQNNRLELLSNILDGCLNLDTITTGNLTTASDSLNQKNTIEETKKITATIQFNLGPISILEKLNNSHDELELLKNILKKNPNAELYILGISDSLSFAKIVKTEKAISINDIDENDVLKRKTLKDSLNNSEITDNNDSQTKINLGFVTILQQLGADLNKVKALIEQLETNENLHPYLMSQSNNSVVDVFQDKRFRTRFSIKDLNVQKVDIELDTDDDGIPEHLDKCPNTPLEARGFVDVNGCLLDRDGDGIPDYIDKCPSDSGVVSNNGCPETKKNIKMLFLRSVSGVQFETGKVIFKNGATKILNEVANAIISNPGYVIEVQGHTDNQGNQAANKLLSERRAHAVRNYLIKMGVDPKQISAVGYGDAKPIASNSTEKGRALNRRVEFIVSFEEVSFGLPDHK